MINFETMTAIALMPRSRITSRVRGDAPWNVRSYPGKQQQCGRNFVPGVAS
jgi:hypothetical protein